MRTIEVSDEIYARLRTASVASGRSEADILDQILDWTVFGGARPAGLAPAAEHTPLPGGAVEVYYDWKGERTHAEFQPGDESVTISSGPLAGTRFDSPSGACRGVAFAITNKREWTATDGLSGASQLLTRSSTPFAPRPSGSLLALSGRGSSGEASMSDLRARFLRPASHRG